MIEDLIKVEPNGKYFDVVFYPFQGSEESMCLSIHCERKHAERYRKAFIQTMIEHKRHS